MGDFIPLSITEVRWLRKLAKARDLDEGWDYNAPCTDWPELVAIGMIEHRKESFRLTDIGQWALGRFFVKEIK